MKHLNGCNNTACTQQTASKSEHNTHVVSKSLRNALTMRQVYMHMQMAQVRSVVIPSHERHARYIRHAVLCVLTKGMLLTIQLQDCESEACLPQGSGCHSSLWTVSAPPPCAVSLLCGTWSMTELCRTVDNTVYIEGLGQALRQQNAMSPHTIVMHCTVLLLQCIHHNLQLRCWLQRLCSITIQT